MRILFCNTYLYRRGGAEVSFFELAELLSLKGHEIVFFGMEDPKNEVSEGSSYFVSNLEFGDYRLRSMLWNTRALRRVLYSHEAASNVRRLIQKTGPDLAYVNNIAHHISPSILDVFREFRLPVMMSVRDYKIICPNSVLLNRSGICEKCKGERYYNSLIHRCKRDSLIPSAVACLEAYLHRHRRTYDSVSAFLAPSQFCKEKLAQFGVSKKRIFVVPNFIKPEDFPLESVTSEPFCVYFGRLSREKGLRVLIEAAKICGHRLLIIGDGELKPSLEHYAEELGAANVSFRDRMGFDELIATVRASLFTVFPGLCYETFGRSVLESFALGKPVVASRIGAIEELVDDGIDGLLCEPGSCEELAEKMSFMYTSKSVAEKMGQNGRTKAMSRFTPGNHYEHFMDVWEKIRP